MNFKQTAADIIELAGGTENITNLTHCVTRLRLVLKDEQKADKDKISSLDGVISCLFSSGQLQVVIGPNVDQVYKEASAIVKPAIENSNANGSASAEPAKKDHSIKGMLKEGLNTLIACFTPCLGVIAGSGMIKVLAVLLSSFGLVPADSTTISLLNVIGDGVFYFLPVFAAYNAANKMKTDPFLAMALGCILLHPSFAALGETGTSISLFGLPVLIGSYSAQALPAIFGVWVLKYANLLAEKVSPALVKVFLKPMIAMLITVPIVWIAVGPVTLWLSDLLMQACMIMQSWGWIAVGINSILFPLMVLTGTHNATIPLIVQMFATQGFDTTFLVSGLAANFGMAAVAAAIALCAKSKKEKAAAGSAALSASLGVTEPALYGIILPNKFAFVTLLVGIFFSGCLLGLAKIVCPAFMTPSLITVALFFGDITNKLLGIIAVASCFVIPFALTFVAAKRAQKKESAANVNHVVSPAKGEVIRLEMVNDPVFSSGSMGQGFAVIPDNGTITSPVEGTVSMIFPTGHAVGITTQSGAEILVHVGIDTVNLNGKCFSSKVQVGQKVRIGTHLIEADLSQIKKEGYDPTTMVIVTNSADFPDMKWKESYDHRLEGLCLQ